jgi:hypothetical protein
MPWGEIDGLALEPSDGSGLSSFLGTHRACDGGIDVERLLGPDGLMIRVTCRHCGRAVEAAAASWEGWRQEKTSDASGPRRRFEPRRNRHGGRNIPPPRLAPAPEPSGAPGWRLALVVLVVLAWTAGGLLLIGSAISQ